MINPVSSDWCGLDWRWAGRATQRGRLCLLSSSRWDNSIIQENDESFLTLYSYLPSEMSRVKSFCLSRSSVWTSDVFIQGWTGSHVEYYLQLSSLIGCEWVDLWAVPWLFLCLVCKHQLSGSACIPLCLFYTSCLVPLHTFNSVLYRLKSCVLSLNLQRKEPSLF